MRSSMLKYEKLTFSGFLATVLRNRTKTYMPLAGEVFSVTMDIVKMGYETVLAHLKKKLKSNLDSYSYYTPSQGLATETNN